MRAGDGERDGGGRPHNALLRYLSAKDFTLLRPFMDSVDGRAGQDLYHPGDSIEHVFFPCGPTLITVAVVVDDERDIEILLVGREGAVGAAVGRGLLPAYSRMTVKMAGPLIRVSARKLENVQRQSSDLQHLLGLYSGCFLAQTFQAAACNNSHTIEQRAAKWLVELVEVSGRNHIKLKHEELAEILGAYRSYASRVLARFGSAGIITIGRSTLAVHYLDALRQRSCQCASLVRKRFTEAFASLERDRGEE